MSEKIDFFALMRQTAETEEPQKKEIKEVAEEVKKATETKEKEPEVVEKTKGTKKISAKKVTKKKEEVSKSRYTYPFGLYTEGRMVDISEYGFKDGQTYEDKEITEIMLSHRHYEFAGDIEYNLIKDDNVLVANLKQHKKG